MFSIFPITVTAMTILGEPAKLTPEQERTVRHVVSTVTPKLVSPNRDFQSIVVVPDDLLMVYRVNPTGTLDLLVRVADGANPEESVTAATYALALLDPQGGGVVCVEHFKKETYDAVDKAWGTTPRYHWIGVIQRARKAR